MQGHGNLQTGEATGGMMEIMPTSPRTTPPRVTPAAAARILAGRDPVIARLLAQAGPPRFGQRDGSHCALTR